MNRMLEIFSPVSWISLSLNWIIIFVSVIGVSITNGFWTSRSQYKKLMSEGLKVIYLNLEALFSPKRVPGARALPLSIFMLIFWNNFIRLFPYVFSASSHPNFRVAIALPLWLGYMLYSHFACPRFMLSLLLPRGRPTGLVPVLILIEGLRSIIRPLTLCIRLTANIIAGHLLLSLVASGVSFSPLLFLLFAGLLFLVVLETCVSLIQSYVFTSLIALYTKEANANLY